MVCVAKTFLLIISDRIRYLTMTDATRIWMPDTFFRNEKIGAFHTILQPNLYIRIFPDGTVLYSIRQGEAPGSVTKWDQICCRVSLTASCSMDLALFPLDEQTCHLYIASCKFLHFLAWIALCFCLTSSREIKCHLNTQKNVNTFLT